MLRRHCSHIIILPFCSVFFYISLMKKITTRQQAIYNYVKEFILLNKFPPTIREIGEKFNIKSTNGVRDAFLSLEKTGLIKKFSRQARSIELLQSAPSLASTIYVPLIGRIAAGTPILAEENIECALTMDKSVLPHSGQIFALRVQGDSMTGDGILSEDLAIIRMQKNAERGQIIAAIIDGEATLKHYYPAENGIELRASNPAYLPIIVGEGENFSIAGILAGVIRKC
jgi:repressor LexA